MGRPGRVLTTAFVVLIPVVDSIASELVRIIDWRSGAPMSRIDDLEQDIDGFFWLTTPQGLIRWDGAEFRTVSHEPYAFAKGCGQHGPMPVFHVTSSEATLLELKNASTSPVALPPGIGPGPLRDAACSDDGALWIVSDAELWRRAPGADWSRVPSEPRTGWTNLWPAKEGAVLATLQGGVFRIAQTGATRLVAKVARSTACVEASDGSVAILDWRMDGTHLLLAGDAVRDLLLFPGRPIDLVERNGTLWISYDGGVVGLKPDGSTTDLQALHGEAESAGVGPLLVDREGALWIAGLSLIGFPEPELSQIRPPTHGRWFHAIGSELFVSGWFGASRIFKSGGVWSRSLEIPSIGAVCSDARGRTWFATLHSLVRRDDATGEVAIPWKNVGDLAPCALDGNGTLWMPTLAGLLRLERDQDLPRIEPLPPGAVFSVTLDRRGRLWAGMEGHVCTTGEATMGLRAWRCDPIPSGTVVGDLVETDGGRLWAASRGVFERADDGVWRPLTIGGWEPLPPEVRGFAPSQRGGVWLVGSGAILRVEGTSNDGSMHVLERLGGWQGVPITSANDAREEADGSLWIAADNTVLRVPGNLRVKPAAPRRVAITAIDAGGSNVPTDREFRVAHGANNVEVRVSAFSYRDPSVLRYRFRIRDQDPWSTPTSSSVFRFYNLGSGHYAMRFAASLDGEHWTETQEAVRFVVDPPWFLRSWFVALVGIAVASAAWVAHRARVARAVALASQRTRIAMDLHDAIGSGLGSIGLLASVSARTDVDVEKKIGISAEIASMADELGTSLSEIVWSLRAGSERLEALAEYLAERAHSMFRESGVRCVTEFPPSWPEVRLSLPLRRNLLLIGIEALHNTAKHARASEVRVGMAPVDGRWSLWVEDDGLGLERGVDPGGGMGLENMTRRAAEIDARVEWKPGRASGTRVTVIFDPRAQGS